MASTDELKPRKKRAIGLLAQKIVNELPDIPDKGETWEISVDQVIKTLSATKGSVYEVFHVLEALLLVTKIGTNTYRWNGYGMFNQTLTFLRLIAIMLNVHGDIQRARDEQVLKLVSNNIDRDVFGNVIMDECGDGKAMKPVETTHILRVCQKFVMLFLVSPTPKAMSLEFAAKVIHGSHLPPDVLKSRTRRLYDVSNVLTSIRHPLMQKVHTTKLNSSRRTAIQYCGPDVESLALSAIDIMLLPEYRHKHMYFDQGKELLKIPVRPCRVDGLTTLRLRPVEGDVPLPVEGNHGLYLDHLAITDLQQPLPCEDIVQLESLRLGVRLRQGGTTPIDESLQPMDIELATPLRRSHETLDTVALAILPKQQRVDECFSNFGPDSPGEARSL